jgi:hypothetical protein
MTTSVPSIHLPKLDRTRSFGEVHGERRFDEQYDQDGFLFRADGTVVEEAMTDADRARLKSVVEQNEALDAARAAFMQKLPDADPAIVAKLITAEGLKKPEPEDEPIDLVAWARQEKRYNFAKVTKAFREKYNQSPVNAAQGLEILAEHGAIPARGGEPTIPSMQ